MHVFPARRSSYLRKAPSTTGVDAQTPFSPLFCMRASLLLWVIFNRHWAATVIMSWHMHCPHASESRHTRQLHQKGTEHDWGRCADALFASILYAGFVTLVGHFQPTLGCYGDYKLAHALSACTFSLHDALPISERHRARLGSMRRRPFRLYSVCGLRYFCG